MAIDQADGAVATHPPAEHEPAVGRFVHLDVLTAYSPSSSPTTPDQYVQTLARQYAIGPASSAKPRPALAIADYGLHSAVKTAVACERAGNDHIVGLRLRVVHQRAFRTWGERPGELILLAMDESGWLSLGVSGICACDSVVQWWAAVTAVAWDQYPSVSSDQWARKWLNILADLGRARNTIDAYGRGLESYLRFSHRVSAEVESANRAHIASYVRALADFPTEPPRADRPGRTDGLSNATMHQRLTVIRLFYDYLVEEGVRIDNPVGRGKYTPGSAFGAMDRRGLLPRYQKLPWIPGDDDWNTIVAAAQAEPLRNQVMLSLAYDGALRREELCRLESRDIDPAHRQIRIRAEVTKSRRERRVRYTESTGLLLREYLGRRCSVDRSQRVLFLSESRRNLGQPISIWTWSKTIEALARRTGLPRFTTHTPRHLQLTDLARADMDIHDIGAYAGHRSIQTTLLYIHLSGRDLARKYDRALESIRRWRAEFPGGRLD